MRKLFVIRIIHTAADMGSMSEELIKEGIEKIGREKWLENQRKIEKFWDEVNKQIEILITDYSKTRVYQDGLPCGGELGLKIVRETADKGSKNYQIIRKLIERGAAIEATESPGLLRKEYDHIKAFITAKTAEEKAATIHLYDQIKDKLMQERDAYIAKSINTTLKDDETGILFIGAAHNVIPGLAEDIDVKNIE